jgi:hypothetical protein
VTWSYRQLRRGFVTPQLISGTVLVSVVIAVADESNGILDVFSITFLSVLVFWVTQIFIEAVAVQGLRDQEEPVPLRESLHIALRKSRGQLYAGIPPLVFIVLGLFGMGEGEIAYWVALWTGVLILAALGWIAFAGRGIAWYWQLCGACATAACGLLAMLLKFLVR